MQTPLESMAGHASLESLIEVYVDVDRPESDQVASSHAIARELLQGRLSIQGLVSTLGTYLTTTDNVIRARGTLLLSEILTELGASPLEDTAIKSLSNFYSSRLGDWHCLRGALLGCLSLLRRTPKVGVVVVEDAREMARLALENLHVQALAQRDRLLCLELFDCLLDKHRAAVAPLEDFIPSRIAWVQNGDLVFGVVAAVEEEKDPRCLLLVFHMIELLARLYPDHQGPVADCAEDLFDIASRYFPISFNPQPGSPQGIMREDLATSLKGAFACTSLFAPYCIPLLLEKLSSSLRRAKLDSLIYLGHCALAYGARPLIHHVGAVWGALKSELLPLTVPASATSPEPKDPEIVEEAINCLTSWVVTFQKEKDVSHAGNKDLEIMDSGSFLQLILKDECVEDLLESVERGEDGLAGLVVNERTKLRAKATGRILAACVQACPSSCFVVCRQVLPRLIAPRSIAPENGHQSSIIKSQQGWEDIVAQQDSQLSGSSSTSTSNAMVARVSEKTLGLGHSVVGLKVLLQILVAGRGLAEECSGTGQGAPSRSAMETSGKWLSPLRHQIQNLLATYCQAIDAEESKELSELGVAGVQVLASFPSSISPLSSNQLRDVLTLLKEKLLCNTELEDFWNRILAALESISNVEKRSGLTSEGSVGILTTVLPDLLEAIRDAKTVSSVDKQLIAVAKICSPRPDARQVLIEGLTKTIHLDLSVDYVNNELDKICGKLVCILRCLSEDILPWCDDRNSDKIVAANLAMEIWNLLQAPGLETDEEVLKWSMGAMRATVIKCDITAQREILQIGEKQLVYASANQSQPIISGPDFPIDVDQTVSYKSNSPTEWNRWLVALVASVVVSLRPTTEVLNKKSLLEMLMRVAADDRYAFIAEAAAQGVASLLNKWIADKNADFTLEDAIQLVLDEGGFLDFRTVNSIGEAPVGMDAEEEEEAGVSGRQKVSGVRAATWVGKGLAMRGHSRVTNVASFLLRVLLSGTSEEGDDSNRAMAAAQGLGIILKDSEVCLNKLHHAVIRPLYKQRFFGSMLSPLLEAVRVSGESAARLWLYRGIGNLVSGTPHLALLADGEKVFPVLLGALSALCTDPSDSDLLLVTLLALSAFLVDVSHGRSIAAEHVSGIVKRLLILIRYPYSVVVRETALQCLGAIVGLPYARVYPMHAEVLRAMTAALDDKKRVVRKEAVRCRQAWSAIASR